MTISFDLIIRDFIPKKLIIDATVILAWIDNDIVKKYIDEDYIMGVITVLWAN